MNHAPREHCLLCDHAGLERSASLTGRQLRNLWDALQIPVSEPAYGAIEPDTEVALYRCRACGFRFYNPEFAGSAEFYEELMASKAYPGGSPEFDHALDFARRNGIGSVLDIGGGEGAFLDLAKNAGLKTAGVELNRKASRVAAAKGHRMFNMAMEDIPLEALDGGAELVTLFQVVEHVGAPVDFVRSASRLIRPGGHLAVAVPSDRRMLGLLANDPADWPPHHVSRWRMEDLVRLGERAGLIMVEYKSNPLFGKSIPWAFALHRTLQKAAGKRMIPLPGLLVKVASLAYRTLRLHHLSALHGLSIRAIYRKPLA